MSPLFISSLMTLTPVMRLRDAHGECGHERRDRGEKQVSVSQHAESRTGDLAGRLRERDSRGREHPGRAERARAPQRGAHRGGDSDRDEREWDQGRWHLGGAAAPRDERKTARGKGEQRDRSGRPRAL